MPVGRETLVADANFLIDIEKGKLLSAIFELNYRWEATVEVLDEIFPHTSKFLIAKGLLRTFLTSTELSRIPELRKKFVAPSFADLTALCVAASQHKVLVTGDRHLRQAARSEGIEVHGTLWVLDELVSSKTIPCKRAADSLTAMVKSQSRFPAAECRKRLREWKGL